MKHNFTKRSVAAAVLTAISAIPAHAVDFQAGGTNMSVYGILDGSVYSMTSNAGSSQGWASNNSATSRLGFSPSRELGNGLKVGGVLEQEIEFATGGSGDGVTTNQQNGAGAPGTFNRAANIYVSSSWGELKLGRQTAPSLALAVSGDTFGYNSGGYLNQWVYSSLLNGLLVTGAGGQANINPNGGNAGVDLFNSGLLYTTPVFGGGFQGKLFTTFGSNYQPITGGGGAGTAFNYGSITDLSLSYASGPFSLALGQLTGKNDPGTPGAATGAIASYDGTALTATQLTASYKADVTKFTFAYGTQVFDSAYRALSGADNMRIVSLGATQNVSDKVRMGVSYTQTDDTSASMTDIRMISLLAEYNADTNTAFYGELSSTQNGNTSNVSGVYGSTLPAPVLSSGGNVTSLTAGVRLKF